MRGVLCAALLVLMSATAGAQAPQVDRINIIDFGIYTATYQKRKKEEKTASGTVAISTDFKLVTQTETVSARLGLRFGINYVVVGKQNGKAVTLDAITRFPPQGVVNVKGETFYQNEIKWDVTIGEPSFRTYKFDHVWEMVPGTWVFEFYYQGRKLVEKRFTVVVP
jgi:hypothetical protein